MSKVLEAVGLKKSYKSGKRQLEILKGIDLAISAGELAVIVGPSGAGKSTLLHLLGGLDRPARGQVLFDGQDLYRLSDKAQSRIRGESFGFVFQFYYLIPELTAFENVLMPAWIASGSRALGAAKQRASMLLRQVGLSDRAAHLPAELSGGEQQRVAIARALINKPRIIFCDEPTGNLDSATGSVILQLLLDLNQKEGTTFVIVTHEPAITKVASKVYSLKDGQLQTDFKEISWAK